MEKSRAPREDIAAVDTARGELSDARAALELAEEMGDDPDAAAPLREEATVTAERLSRAIDELELSSWFTGEFDRGDAIVTIKPGQGGLEAQDWTFMLFKMYMKYCQRRGWKVTINDCPAAEVIGIDRATFTVEGKDAFGMLRAEAGVHRLVRISPTDDKKRRQTTFAGVEVIPCFPMISTSDRSRRHPRGRVPRRAARRSGRQHHRLRRARDAFSQRHCGYLPKRAQPDPEQGRVHADPPRLACTRLSSKRAEALDEIRGPKTTIGFGNQIRSYVLYPYQMVKDLRSGVETSNVEGPFLTMVTWTRLLLATIVGPPAMLTRRTHLPKPLGLCGNGFNHRTGWFCIQNKPVAGWFCPANR